MPPLSLLDFAFISSGESVAQAIARTAVMARHAETHGYERYWLAEHHSTHIASASTALLMANAAQATQSIRIGAGGIMLPNHTPLTVAEQFGTLEALFPGRIDLGLGRASGSDQRVASALQRRDRPNFPAEVVQVAALLAEPEAGQMLIATPGAGSNVPIWLLGSSTFSAELAAVLGLPFAFASHFAPGLLMSALAQYRRLFKPSAALSRPYAMVAFTGIAADSDDEAEYLLTSMQQMFVDLQRDTVTRFPPPISDASGRWTIDERRQVDRQLAMAITGAQPKIEREIARLIEVTNADELIVAMPIHDLGKAKRSIEIFAAAAGLSRPSAPSEVQA